MTILEAALDYEARGWSVLPLCPPDHLGVLVGSKEHRGCQSPGKRPFFPNRSSGSGDWKEFQTRRAAPEEISSWWNYHRSLNVGVALGSVSGLIGIDVDDEEGDTLLEDLAAGDLPATWEYTTGKGRRLLYRLPAGVSVVNQAFKRLGTEIEILRFMSSGGQVVLPPSIHPNGATYTWKALHGPDEIELADVPEWMRGEHKKGSGDSYRPVDGELITEGGRNNYLTSLAGAMRKHGADEETIYSALQTCNVNRCDPQLAEPEIRAIARSVSRYAPDAHSGVTFKATESGRVPPPHDGERARKFKWASELAAPPKADEWLWHGYLPRGGITLLSALWKSGKTTLLAHLLRALATDGEFLGQRIRASKVLYVSEEGEAHWVRRRDDLGFGDHAGFYLQPFASKPDGVTWAVFVGQLRDDVKEHGFDLVVFDTLAKLWPVIEENDAGSVDAALMPLWEITKAGASVLLIHHLRKSGGAEYTASRGSGALSAFPDILIELTRFDAQNAKCHKRTLKAKGRYDETPDELVIELIGTEYRHVPNQNEFDETGRASAPEPKTEEDRILYTLAHNPTPWMTIEEIRVALRVRKWGIRNKDLTDHLFSLFSVGRLMIDGKPRSPNDPQKYCHASRVSEVVP